MQTSYIKKMNCLVVWLFGQLFNIFLYYTVTYIIVRSLPKYIQKCCLGKSVYKALLNKQRKCFMENSIKMNILPNEKNFYQVKQYPLLTFFFFLLKL